MFNYRPILFVIGQVLSRLAMFMWIPTLVALFTASGAFSDFALAVIITHIAALLCISLGRRATFTMSVRDMFLITTFVWIFASTFAALPFVFINHISFTDAYFETMSGITTTGSTVLSGLDDMAPSILLWRSLLQWLGGVGFIVIAVAILPMLNVGGMKLFQTESSDWSDKSHPRAKHVATNIMLMYLALTALCTIGYILTGMSVFDAFNHAFTTISTGGYSTSDASMNHFSNAAHWVAITFMFAGGVPFLLLVQSLKHKEPQLFLKDAQVQGFIFLTLIASIAVAIRLYSSGQFAFIDALRISLFNTISVITTTGYGLDDFSTWGAFPSIVFAFIMLVGACSGSTAGGIKIFRFQVAIALLKKQMSQLVHPSGLFIQRYNGRALTDDIVRSVVAFALTFVITIVGIAALLGIIGLDPITSITGAVTAVANVGPGMGDIIGPSGNFSSLPDSAKWLLSIGMLMGRLEILTVLVLFFPMFWRN